MKWQPIETAPKGKSVLLYAGPLCPMYCGRQRFGNLGEPQQDVHAWRCDSSGRFATPSHWKPLPAAPWIDVVAKAAPFGWRAVIDSHRDGLLDTEPSSYDSPGYRDFARSVLDGVADELAALEADPATKRQEAEAIKAEFLERTGQYLTNDASREACIAEAVAEAANADTARLDWLGQHDGRYYNHDRIACIVGTGFLIGSLDQVNRDHDTLRGAIDAARAAQAKEGNAA